MNEEYMKRILEKKHISMEDLLWPLLLHGYIPKNDSNYVANSQSGKISFVCQGVLDTMLIMFTPKSALERYLAVEKDKDVLKKELKQLVKEAYDSNRLKDPEDFDVFELTDEGMENTKLYLKYKDCANVNKLQLTFPDLFYAVVKKQPNLGVRPLKWLTRIYKNFPLILANIGIIGLLPKGKKFGGFVKVLLHVAYKKCLENHMEIALGSCLSIYRHSFVAQGPRNQWFDKLQLDEKDCDSWTESFNKQFPAYVDIHEFFEQTA